VSYTYFWQQEKIVRIFLVKRKYYIIYSSHRDLIVVLQLLIFSASSIDLEVVRLRDYLLSQVKLDLGMK